MCGIAGIYDDDRPIASELVPRMLAVLEHRGPDGSGVRAVADEAVALGHRRLAIIDTTDAAAQPMTCAHDRYVITYNGEVYNYVELRAELEQLGVRFRSGSDTEVLLAGYAEWGESVLERLNGMFAFAIYDRVERTLFCARDRLGVKPFVYIWDGHRLGFASETKALLAAGLASGQRSPDAIYEYLARGYTTAGRSFFAGVEQLPPGHALRLTPGGSFTTWRWWDAASFPVVEDRSVEEWVACVADLLDDAVRLRLRSDVPVGAHLSGGLDSSAVVAAAARHSSDPIQTFTGAFVDDADSDERVYSRMVVAHTGAVAHEVELSVDELAGHFERIAWHMDEPIAGPGVFPQLMVCDLVAQAGVKVVLGGQGGDELFGGYLRHRALHLRRRLRDRNPVVAAGAAISLLRLVRGELSRVRRTATRVGDGQLAPSFLAAVDPELRDEVRRPALSLGSARELMLWDLRNYLPALLHVEDRTSMAASIESRTPLLDYRLVELALAMPERLHFTGGVPKPVLRAAVAPWLPAPVVQRRDKRGFPTPLEHWRSRPALRGLVERVVERAGTAGDVTVFGSDYLARARTFQPSELWTVLAVQGWLEGLGAGGGRAGSERPAA